MAEVWEVTVGTGDFVGLVVIDDTTGNANCAICPLSSTAGPCSGQIKNFAFTQDFNVGQQYAFYNGKGGGSTYTGQVTYTNPARITTNWTAQKKSSARRKHHRGRRAA